MIDINQFLFNSSTVSDIAAGLLWNGDTRAYLCLFCPATFEKGIVYRVDDTLLEAGRAAIQHVHDTHGDVFELLLGLGKARTGITDVQREILQQMYAGLNDAEIARKLGGKSPSTVRNHRFQLRKRKKEAKIFLALMELLESRAAQGRGFIDFHGEIPVQDERTIVTVEEAEDIMKKAFEPGDSMVLRAFPKKQKAKLVVLNRLVELFEMGRHYPESEINRVLRLVYDDYVTLRRYLIEYGFLDRKADGSDYWRIGS